MYVYLLLARRSAEADIYIIQVSDSMRVAEEARIRWLRDHPDGRTRIERHTVIQDEAGQETGGRDP